jgi:hypothetical protein
MEWRLPALMRLPGIAVFTLAFFGFLPTIIAEETLEVPAPAPQTRPRVPQPRRTPIPRPIRTPQPQELVEPEPPPPPVVEPPVAEEPPPRREIVPPAAQERLPEIFRGCWEGAVPYVDTIYSLPGAAPIGPWTAKRFRICYERTGDGPFALTFTDVGIAFHELIINPTGRVEIVDTDGQTYATLRAYLNFDERRSRNPSSTFAVAEVMRMECQIVGDLMRVRARVYGERDAAPWFRATWRATFRHVSH